MSDVLLQMDEATQRVWLEIRRKSVVECDALLLAGWKFELPEVVNNWPNSESEPWQWYWRRPPRRKGSKGMKFWSTTQAYNAMKREKEVVA